MTTQHTLSVEIPFNGFYESSHAAHFDTWLEYESEVCRDEYGATDEQLDALADKFYSDINWRAAYSQYAKGYCARLCYYIQDESRQYKINEKGERYLSEGLALSIEFEELKSPRYYNYETDRIYGRIPATQLEEMRQAIPPEDWKAWVEKNCTSYDGFISFHSANADEWPADLCQWGEARLGLLLEAYLIHIVGSEDKARDALAWDVMEDAMGSGFIDDCIFANASDAFKRFVSSLREGKAA